MPRSSFATATCASLTVLFFFTEIAACTSSASTGPTQPDASATDSGFPADGDSATTDGGQPGQPDSAGDGAIPDVAADAPDTAPPPRKRVFVTSTEYDGDLKTAGAGTDGLSGADALCAARASVAGLSGTFLAYLSTSTVNAKNRIADVGPWYLVDKTTEVFPSKAALSTTPLHAIEQTELGTVVVKSVHTGTTTGGGATSDTCTDWTTTSTNQTYGSCSEVTSSWVAFGVAPCIDNGAIYCFEQ
jgi:hypothetical protein